MSQAITYGVPWSKISMTYAEYCKEFKLSATDEEIHAATMLEARGLRFSRDFGTMNVETVWACLLIEAAK